MRWAWLSISSVAGVLLLTLLPALSAQDCEKAQQLVDQGLALNTNDDREAKLYMEAARLCPDYPAPHNNLAYIRYSQGKYAEAVKSYRKLLALQPKNPDAHFNLAESLRRIGGDAAEIARHYQTFIRLAASEASQREWVQKARTRLAAFQPKLPKLAPPRPEVKAKEPPAGVPPQGPMEPKPSGARQELALTAPPPPERLAVPAPLLFAKPFTHAPEIVAHLMRPRLRDVGVLGEPRIPIRIEFFFDSTDVVPESLPQLQEAGKALRDPKLIPYRVLIEGHTDSIGSEAYNQRLSERRAEAIKKHIVRFFGISPERLVVRGFGEDRPRADNSTEQGRARNRRVELVRLERMQ